MRKIKFRAWDKANKEMYQVRTLEWDSLIGVALPSDVDLIMQFTGLLDKNGVEIYEGDVLSFHKKSVPSGVVEFDKFIGFCLRWDNSTAKIRNEKKSDGMPGNLESSGSPWEVIGNIYESKHLLENTTS